MGGMFEVKTKLPSGYEMLTVMRVNHPAEIALKIKERVPEGKIIGVTLVDERRGS
jgi:hypothetical protein